MRIRNRPFEARVVMERSVANDLNKMLAATVCAFTAVGLAAADQGESTDFPNPQLARLDAFVGTWRVTEQHFNDRGDEVASADGTEEIIWMLDRHAIKRTYQTTAKASRFSAVGTFTWNDRAKKYVGVWFDNVSTSVPVRVQGDWDETEAAFVFLIETGAADGSTVRHKVVERFPDEKTRVATTYLIEGDQAIKRLEVEYRRTQPCPSRPSVIGGPEQE